MGEKFAAGIIEIRKRNNIKNGSNCNDIQLELFIIRKQEKVRRQSSKIMMKLQEKKDKNRRLRNEEKNEWKEKRSK